MTNLRSISLSVLAIALLGTASLFAQRPAPAVRIVEPIDEGQLVTLKGNTHPLANSKNDKGRVSSSLPMTDLILVLSRSPEQQAAFNAYVTSEYDQSSSNFHQWLTPDQIGIQYGPAASDIATISNWLAGHGLAVKEVTKDHLSIRFSGTAGQVESAFHTEIHNLSVNGAAHIGNMSDPQIPAALAPSIVGVKSLHDFFAHPLHHIGSPAAKDSGTGKWKRVTDMHVAGAASVRTLIAPPSQSRTALPSSATPPQFGINVGGTDPYLVEDVAPYDFATIYNVLPLWNESTPIDGTGQIIAIAGTSDIDVGQSTTETGTNGNNDVATFRTFFGLPTGNAANTPIRLSGNSEPLTVCTDTTGTVPYASNPCGQDDLIENSLDVEWSGSIAKNAQIILVSSYPASVSDDNLYDSESYIVNNVTARIMNVSYGECELGNGTAGNQQYYNLWQQAAAEGIAVFVAAGDSGAASCDDGGDEGGDNLPYPAEYGLSVSGLASTPWNTAVGGTDFNWCSLTSTECTAAPYWTTTNSASANAPESSALGYVPEVPWNDTCTSSLATAWMKQYWSGYPYENNNGSSVSVTDNETGCNAFVYYASQLSDSGDGELLYLVDTIGGGGGASNCVVNGSSDTTTAAVSSCTGTAISTNSGTVNLVNDGWPQPSWQTGVTGIPTDGVRHIPDVSFFASDGFLSSSAYLVCVSDVTTCSYSAKSEPVFLEVGGTSVATPAMAGVMGLIDAKTGASQGSPNAELYRLAAAQTYSNCSAESVATSSNCYFNDVDTGTNAMACDYNAYVNTPSPNCTVAHSGDYVGILPGYSAGVGYDQATGLGSLNVANVVKAWPAAVGTTSATVTVTPAFTIVNSNNSLSVTVAVTSTTTGDVTPTGTVTLTVNGTTFSASGTLSNSGTYVFTIPAGSLPGSASGQADTLTVAYGGDVLYAAASNTATITVSNVALLVPTVTVIPASATPASNTILVVTGTVSGTGAVPTGTVTLTVGNYTSAALTLVSGAYSFTGTNAIPANTLSSGANTITISYSGDSNYAAGSNTATVTVAAATVILTQSAIAILPSAATTTAGIAPGASATATVTVSALAGYTGTVTLTCQETSSTASSTSDGAGCTGGGSPGINLTSTNTSGTVLFTITTTAPSTTTAALVGPKVRGGSWTDAASGAVLALLVFLGIPSRRRSWQQMLGVLAVTVVLGAMISCGSGGSAGNGGSTTTSDPGTTAGTYTFKVQATGTPAASTSTTFTVTVN